jgi:cytoskeleton protein RodZ
VTVSALPPAPKPVPAPAAAVLTPAAKPSASLLDSATPPPGPIASKPATPPAPADSGSGQVVIRAVADCWIQVRSSDQTIVFSRILKSGETYKVPPRAGLSLRTGNAGALEIIVDGKSVPSIGGIGALRRDVVLDPAELNAGTAVHG